MLNFQRIFTILAVISMTACGSTATNSDDAFVDDAFAGSDTVSDVFVDDVPTGATYQSIVIWDKSQDPGYINGKCGTSPGTDLDCVGLYRGGTLIAVGKPGTASFVAPAVASPCTVTANKSQASAAEGPLDAHVYASDPDTGYISLNGGSLEIQFGACVSGTTITDCDGAGAVVPIQTGDQVGIWEVDGTYKAGGSDPQSGNAFDGCVCYADQYQVDFRPTVGSELGSAYVPSDPNAYDVGTTKITAP